MPWYAWILLALQFLAFVLIYGLKQKKEDSVPAREEKIFQLYGQIEEMLDSFEAYVGEVHTQLEDKRTELIELNRQAQVVYLQALDGSKPAAASENLLSAKQSVAAAAPPKPSKPEKQSSRLTDKDKETLGRLATKPQKVRLLMSRGLSIDEVAKELDIGKGEVMLIADLDKT